MEILPEVLREVAVTNKQTIRKKEEQTPSET